MSQVYLTKIERKTIFTRSLIFVLIMFIISDLTVTGPFFFNFVPWMFLLGLLGSMKNIDSILMCIIGTFTVFISSIIKEAGIDLNSIIATTSTLAVIILGIVSGKLINEFVLEHRLVKYIKPKRKVIYIALIILMFVLSVGIVGIVYGDVIGFLKSRRNLDGYISKTYGKVEYNVTNVKYERKLPGRYSYTLNMKGESVHFVPVTTITFKDANINERQDMLNKEIKDEMDPLVQSLINVKYNGLFDIDISFIYEYTKIDVKPNILAAYINIKNYEEKYIKEITDLIKDVYDLNEKVDKMVITINKARIELTKDNIKNLTEKYLKGAMEVIELDEFMED